MGSHNNTRSSLFLIELIIAILFFSLGSAVCAQAFVKAHSLTAQAEDLSFASSTCSSAASVMKYTDGTLEQVQVYFPGAVDRDGDIVACFGEDFAPCGADAAAYTMRIHTEGPGLARTSSIRMDDRDGDKLYELQISYPAPEEVSYG